MTRIHTAETAGFAREDVKAVARRQLSMSIGLVGVLAAATVIASFAMTRPQGPVSAKAVSPSQQALVMSSRG